MSFHDFCLSCDRQTTDGAYCSQACRLADLEKAGSSEPASPLSAHRYYTPTASASSYGSTSSTSSSSGFHLSPAFNFSAYKTAAPRTTTPPSPRPASQSTYFTAPAYTSERAAPRSLASPSSRASLSSIASSSGPNGLSDQALCQLRGYASAFDSTRDYRRRMTYG